jgi:hypothetical protein
LIRSRRRLAPPAAGLTYAVRHGSKAYYPDRHAGSSRRSPAPKDRIG